MTITFDENIFPIINMLNIAMESNLFVTIIVHVRKKPYKQHNVVSVCQDGLYDISHT